MLITHILSAITVGIIFKKWKKSLDYKINTNLPISSSINQKDFGTVLTESIKKSITTILNIGGFIVLFSVIISILESIKFFTLAKIIISIFGISENISVPLLTGFLEISNGISRINIVDYTNISKLIILAAFLLGFGGISVVLQVKSIISKTDISIKPYVLAKVLQGIIASIYTFLVMNLVTNIL